MAKKKAKSEPTLQEVVKTVLGENYYYSLDVDYDRSCVGECSPNDYCRCARISDIRITNADNAIRSIVGGITKKVSPGGFGLSEIQQYSLERVLMALKVYEGDNWHVDVTGGYYGDEIGPVRLQWGVQDTIAEHLIAIVELGDNACIEYILKLEYGYVLDSLQKRNWSVQKINEKNIVFGQEDHYRRLERNIVEKYYDYDYPRGIVVPIDNVIMHEDTRYRLIDGYHRCAAYREKHEGKKVKIICGV